MAWQDSDITGGKVRIKQSAVAGESLGASGLVPGELAINTVDGRIFYKKSDGTVGAVPSGLTTQINITDGSGEHVFTFINGILTAYDLV